MPRKKASSFITNQETLTVINNIYNNVFSINEGSFDECEWCFQFDDNEPQVFATGSNRYKEEPKLMITLTNKVNSNLIFTKDGKTFKIFTRKKS